MRNFGDDEEDSGVGTNDSTWDNNVVETNDNTTNNDVAEAINDNNDNSRDGELGTIVIEVRDDEERPVEGAKVDIQTPIWPASGFTDAGVTDEKGQVRISDPGYVKPISDSSQNTVYINGKVSDSGTSLNPGGHVFHKK